MDIYQLVSIIFSTPVSAISFVIVLLSILAIVVVKIFSKKNSKKWELPAIMLFTFASAVAAFGISYNMDLEVKAYQSASSEQVKNDHRVTNRVYDNEIQKAAKTSSTLVFSDPNGNYDVRPHLDGKNLTFFRVDNGAQIKPLY